MRILASVLSLSLVSATLVAQDKPACCLEGQKAEACCATASPAKTLAVLTADIKAMPAERKAELAAAAKTVAELCPVAQGSMQLLAVLHGASKQISSGCCKAMPAGSHEGEGDQAAVSNTDRVSALVNTVDAQMALLAELGVQPGQGTCCKGDAAACCKDAVKAGGSPCCAEGEKAATLAHCNDEMMTAFAAIPAKVKALDAATKAKLKDAAEVLAQAKVAPAIHGALAFYGKELNALAASLDMATVKGERAAEGGCPAGEGMASEAASMAKLTGELAALTNAFGKAAAAAAGTGECCDGVKDCCEAGKACCQTKAAAAEPAKKNN